MPPMKMEHSVSPERELLEKLGDTSKVDVFNNQVLVALYIRPQKTKSGIFLTENAVDEDRYQSKVGLVIKMGETAFQDPDRRWFRGMKIALNDWLVFRPSDGWALAVNGVPCRLVDDVNIKARIDHPDQIW